LHVERLHVGLRVDGESLDSKLAAGADNAKGDFAAIGNEDLLDHGRRLPKLGLHGRRDQQGRRDGEDRPPAS
jgi:hypothetical protein